MTDRIKGLYVSLNADYRDDSIDDIVSAIKMIKCVQDVTLSVTDPDDWMNRSRISYEYRRKIMDALEELK